MDISSVNSDLIRGNSTTIILGSLCNRDRYGYEIIQEIEEKTEGTDKVKQATLYNQLKKLEKAGLISSYEGDPDDTGGGRRRYYSLTNEGRELLSKEKNEYVFSRTILDKLISEEEFDFSTPAPFDTDTLRPYTKTGEEAKPKVVYKEKIVEVEGYGYKYFICEKEDGTCSLYDIDGYCRISYEDGYKELKVLRSSFGYNSIFVHG